MCPISSNQEISGSSTGNLSKHGCHWTENKSYHQFSDQGEHVGLGGLGALFLVVFGVLDWVRGEAGAGGGEEIVRPR